MFLCVINSKVSGLSKTDIFLSYDTSNFGMFTFRKRIFSYHFLATTARHLHWSRIHPLNRLHPLPRGQDNNARRSKPKNQRRKRVVANFNLKITVSEDLFVYFIHFLMITFVICCPIKYIDIRDATYVNEQECKLLLVV